MNEIKVTVAYEKPTTSKFDALMAEYEAAKKYADETVSYYKPLADAAEDAKFDAIMEQLETIKGYVKRISDIDNKSVWISIKIPAEVRGGCSDCSGDGYFKVIYRIEDGFEIMWNGYEFTKERMHRRPFGMCQEYNNIIGNWNEWGVYERLEKEALTQLRGKINEQKRRGNQERNRLNNITKGGN